MTSVPNSVRFRRLADDRGLLLRTADADEPRFIFALKDGPIVACQHPTQARDLLRLAESVFGPGAGEVLEIARLVAMREDLDEGSESSTIVWQPPDRVFSGLNPGKWVRFDEWVADQHLMEDAMMLDGPMDKEEKP